MIGGLLLGILTAIFTGLLNLLPNQSSLPEGFTNAWDWISGLIANLFWTVPGGTTLLTILGFVMLIEGAIFGWKSLKWVLNLLRGSGA